MHSLQTHYILFILLYFLHIPLSTYTFTAQQLTIKVHVVPFTAFK